MHKPQAQTITSGLCLMGKQRDALASPRERLNPGM